MRQFFLEGQAKKGQEVLLSPPDSHHLLRVLRAQPGQVLGIVAGGQAFEGVLVNEDGGRARVKLIRSLEREASPRRLILIQAMVKGTKFEDILAQATEVGVDGFYPLQLSRSVSDIRTKYEKKRPRFEKILKGAAQQSNRLEVPSLGDYLVLEDLKDLLGPEDLLLVPYEEEKGQADLAQALAQKTGHVYYLIGPEGGIAPEEVAYLKDLGALTLSLGPRILRSQTAAIVAGHVIKREMEVGHGPL